MEFVDTHCHIHASEYDFDQELVLESAKRAGVTKLICVGTSENDSKEAVEFASKHQNVWASVGLHPHDAKLGDEAFSKLGKLVKQPKVVAIGECGLDFFYNNSSPLDQERALRFQIELALDNNLPLIFHVRNAFKEFWPIFDSYSGLKGVIHSFSASKKELDQVLERNLYVSLNGIMTFTKKDDQLQAAKEVPLDRLLLETDAPYLTPAPLRGKINEPKNVVLVAEFLSRLRQETLEDIALASTKNSEHLFNIN